MPKSRGRRLKHGGKKPIRRSPVPVRISDLMIRDARRITSWQDPLQVETWASDFLGQAWYAAPMGGRDTEHHFCMEVAGQASSTPSPHGLAAVAALARIAGPKEAEMLAETIEILADSQPLPPWHSAEDPAWTPVKAWRAANVWDSERVLVVDYDGPHPHSLLAQVERTGGLWVGVLSAIEPGVADRWAELRADQEVPMPLAEQPVAEVLAELADALRTTDITWPRNDGDDYISYRALAWSRCRGYLVQEWTEPERLPETEIRRLVDDFAAATGQEDAATRSLAELFLSYGEDYIRSGPLAWSPDQVMLFLTDWLPRKGFLDAPQRAALPDTLREWVAFALRQRGLDDEWIAPVVQAVDDHLDVFHEAFDDKDAWGPAKQVTAALADLGVDLTDPEAVKQAISSLNARRLADNLAGQLEE